jgi:cyclopropane-fatty-acyl-phospholipid synthase
LTFAPAHPHPADAVHVDQASAQTHVRDLPLAFRKAIQLATRIERGTLTAQLPDGRKLRFTGAEPGPNAAIIVHEVSFARRLIAGGEIGFAEAYLRGEWDTPDLTAFLELFCVNHSLIARMLEGRPVTRFVQLVGHWLNRNTRRGSRRNIHAHYDLGNAFYRRLA